MTPHRLMQPCRGHCRSSTAYFKHPAVTFSARCTQWTALPGMHVPASASPCKVEQCWQARSPSWWRHGPLAQVTRLTADVYQWVQVPLVRVKCCAKQSLCQVSDRNDILLLALLPISRQGCEHSASIGLFCEACGAGLRLGRGGSSDGTHTAGRVPQQVVQEAWCLGD